MPFEGQHLGTPTPPDTEFYHGGRGPPVPETAPSAGGRARHPAQPPPPRLSAAHAPHAAGLLCSFLEYLYGRFGSRFSTNKNANIVVQIISKALMKFTPLHY